MDITEERHGDVVVLRCTGDGADGWKALSDRVEAIGSADVVLDFSALQAVDPSPVVGALAAFPHVRDHGGRLAVVPGDLTVWKQFLGMDIIQRLHLCDTLDDALEFLAD